MKLAIMQPYFLPYVGYFQLIAAVDKFVFLDDVQFIMRGWINRNRLLKEGGDWMFTIPLVGASQNRLISEIEVVDPAQWQRKLLGTIQHLYRKSPYYPQVFPWLERLLSESDRAVATWTKNSVRAVLKYVGIERNLIDTSATYQNRDLKGADRIVDICRQEQAACYVNPPGGRELYSPPAFAAIHCELKFLQPNLIAYPQYQHDFVPGLSILDAMMFNSPEQLRALIECGEVVS